jgi:inosose dehydratase
VVGLSRRELFRGISVAGAGSMLSPLLHHAVAGVVAPALLYPPMELSHFDVPVSRGATSLKIGCAAITWGGKDAEAMAQIAALGYPGIQLRANVVEEYPEANALAAALAEHTLTLVALSSGNCTLDPAKEKETLATHRAHAKYLHAAGGQYLQVIGAGNFKSGQSWTAADYQRQGMLLTEIGKRAAEFGIPVGFHNHMGTIAESPQGLDAILAAADANYVKLELDVAHYVQGGGDPAAAVRKYGQRLLFLHLKDVKAETRAKGGYEFVELGQGRVDFKALLAALDAVQFRGWGVVELDGERPGDTRTPEESARMSKQYLEQMGVRV